MAKTRSDTVGTAGSVVCPGFSPHGGKEGGAGILNCLSQHLFSCLTCCEVYTVHPDGFSVQTSDALHPG